MSMPPFRTIKLRGKKPTCAACGVDGQRLGAIHETDYIAFCGGPRPDWQARGLVSGNLGDRISAQVKCSVPRCKEYSQLLSGVTNKTGIAGTMRVA